MECIICNGPMAYYFSKKFGEFGLGVVDYWKCRDCGFCASKTHFDMPPEEWGALNDAFHAITHGCEANPYNRNQRYFNQALMLHLGRTHGVVPQGKWLDWGCGVGAVAEQLARHFGQHLWTHDKFYRPHLNVISDADLVPRQFQLVLNTAVFEHVRDRATLDEIESYVAPDGCLAVHTLVPGAVPKDPEWMYLLPVHCAFHTNRSMGLLMEQWGYKCSVYNEHAKLWILLRREPEEVMSAVEGLNRLMGWEYLHFKRGFMDFWP